MHGLAVTTVEGIGSTHDRLHSVQERIAKAHGSQCGFCTPGIVMSMYTLLRNKQKIDYTDIETALQGNLCRCTGYRPIIDGFKTFKEGWERSYTTGNRNICVMGKACCRNKSSECEEPTMLKKSGFQPYDPTQEPIFPPELKLNERYSNAFTFYKSDNVVWIMPNTLKDLLLIKDKFPESKIVAGNTEIGVEMKFKKRAYPILLYPQFIKEMNLCNITNIGIVVGANINLSNLHDILEIETAKDKKKGKTFEAITEMLHWFGGSQVRNVATLVGNIVTASPISDLNPILMACSAIVNVYSLQRGQRNIIIDEDFFEGYRKTAIKNDEVVISVEIPFTKGTQFVKAYKQARRKDDDISIVTAAFNVTLDENNALVEDAKLCFGGMGPTTICAKNTSCSLKKLQWNEHTLQFVFDILTRELELDASVPGGMADYRKSLCLSLFYKFFDYVLQTTSNKLNKTNDYNDTDEQMSAVHCLPTLEPMSSQYFEILDDGRKTFNSVGKSIVHASAFKHATGEAIYCDDIPQVNGELFLTLVLSTESHANITNIDASEALAVPGVVAFLSAKDLDEQANKMGPILKDEEIFSRHLVTSRNCVIGAVVATTESIARKAKDLVSVTYKRLEPVIITLEDAIAHKSFFDGYPRTLKKGNIKEVFKHSKYTKKGSIRSGAQEHFYLETISAFAIRKEDELEIISTTQNPADITVSKKCFTFSVDGIKSTIHGVICFVNSFACFSI